MKKQRTILVTCSVLVLICLCGGLISSAAGGGVLYLRPSIAAEGAGFIRKLFGNTPIRILETVAFTLQDSFRQLLYGLGLQHAQAPWQAPTARPTLLPTLIPTPEGTQPDVTPGTPPPVEGKPGATLTPPPQGGAPADENSIPSRSRSGFNLQPLAPIGHLAGEGVWTDYLTNPGGRVVARRTFLQPDPARPYTIIAIVAFDLTQTRLHYVLGYEEPGTAGMDIYAAIPPEELDADKLLAAFNGGFLKSNGSYGAMTGGVEPVPPSMGLATVSIYKDGSIWMGIYEEMPNPHGIVAYRQNGPLIIHAGAVTPEVKRNRVQDWGGSINGEIVTYRSGIALNADRSVLYYFAGSSLDLPTLARAMQAAGVTEGMQLDINDYWVYFSAFFADGNTLRPEPLLPDVMQEHIDRYLHPSPRDFFYITNVPVD